MLKKPIPSVRIPRPGLRLVRALALAALLAAALAPCACTPRADAPVADLVTLVQDAGAYHGLDPDTPLIPPDVQREAFARFIKAHFDPWDRTAPLFAAKDVFWGIDQYTDKALYGENTLRRDPAWIEGMRALSRPDRYPSLGRRAIAVANTSMRVLPTDQPAFFAFDRAGEGYPFDYMQNSLVLAGTPLYATHISADRAWVMVESRFTFGWVKVTDIGWVDDVFVSVFRTGSFAAITRDDVPIATGEGDYRFTGHVGTILPVLEGGAGANGFAFIIPARTRHGDAVAQVAFLPDAFAQAAPVPATPANFARLANAMLGRQYGWGGLYEGRDCSALTMDLMAAFGILLPRNSSQQLRLGAPVSLEGLDSRERKELITRTAIPFLTLIGKPGHIAIYIGSRDGEPVIMQAVWGLKTLVDDVPGRKIIGRTVITTLEPGIERDDLHRPDGILLKAITTINTLPPPTVPEPDAPEQDTP
jgi:cell wall-associated NlpC family hydrolase